MAHKRKPKHKHKRECVVHTLTLSERIHAQTQLRSAWVTDDRIPAHGQARVFGEHRWRMV